MQCVNTQNETEKEPRLLGLTGVGTPWQNWDGKRQGWGGGGQVFLLGSVLSLLSSWQRVVLKEKVSSYFRCLDRIKAF